MSPQLIGAAHKGLTAAGDTVNSGSAATTVGTNDLFDLMGSVDSGLSC